MTTSDVNHWAVPGQPASTPWETGLGLLDDGLDALVELNPGFLTTEEKKTVLARLSRLQARLSALETSVVAVAGDIPAESGDKSVAAWMSRALHIEPNIARARAHLAADLDSTWTRVAAAHAAGDLTEHQTRIIVAGLNDLAADSIDHGGLVTPAHLAKAEQLLIEEASKLTPGRLRQAARHILAVIDPDLFDQAEARRLERAEEAAARRVSLTSRNNHDGTLEFHIKIPLTIGARFKTALEAYAQPRKQKLAENGQRQPWDRLMGQAFIRYVENYDPDTLPSHGGDAALVMVTMTLDQLRRELATANLGYQGETITAGEARRLACNAQIIPAVLGSHSEILDLGRASRLATPVQRKALRATYTTCCAEGCDLPADWCDAHHLTPWAHGGRTNLRDMVLLCPHHHRIAHKANYRHERLADGSIRFNRRL